MRAPFHGVEKVHLETIAQVIAAQVDSPPAAARKVGRENVVGVAEIGKTFGVFVALRPGVSLCKIAIILALRLLVSGRVDFTGIEPRTLLLIAENVGEFYIFRYLTPCIYVSRVIVSYALPSFSFLRLPTLSVTFDRNVISLISLNRLFIGVILSY